MGKGKSNVEPRHVFQQGIDFLFASEVLRKFSMEKMRASRAKRFRPGVTLAESTPTVILNSLSLEFFLKTFLYLRNVQVPGTHNLFRLFALLPPSDQADLMARYDKLIQAQRKPGKNLASSGFDKLDEALKKMANGFESRRYWYEDIPASRGEYLIGSSVPRVFVQAIIAIKPSWAKDVSRPGPLPTFRLL